MQEYIYIRFEELSYQFLLLIVWSGFQSNSVISIKKICNFITAINMFHRIRYIL